MKTQRVRKVALFGLFGVGNLGNDASLASMIALLSRALPDAEITCLCSNPEEVARRYAVHALSFGLQDSEKALPALLRRLLPAKLGNLARVAQQARDYQILIFPGTGILDDFGASPWSLPLSILGWCVAGRLAGARIAFVSIGAGPIHHPLSRWLMKRAAALAHYRSYRDEVSRAFMRDIGLDVGRDPVFPDLAFALPTPTRASPARRCAGSPVIGLGVMSYYGWRHDRQRGAAIYRTYLGKLATFSIWLLKGGYRIRFLMSDRADQAAVDDLKRMLAAALPELPADAVLADAAYTLDDVMRQVGQTDLVVATRFHTLVSALMMARPAISIGYASKNDALLAEVGLGEFCQYIETFDVDVLIDQFSRLFHSRGVHLPKIRKTTGLYRERLALQERTLARLLPVSRRDPAARAASGRARREGMPS